MTEQPSKEHMKNKLHQKIEEKKLRRKNKVQKKIKFNSYLEKIGVLESDMKTLAEKFAQLNKQK